MKVEFKLLENKAVSYKRVINRSIDKMSDKEIKEKISSLKKQYSKVEKEGSKVTVKQSNKKIIVTITGKANKFDLLSNKNSNNL